MKVLDFPGPQRPGADASDHLRAVIAGLESRALTFNERDALKAIEGPLERIKAGTPDERLDFVLEALHWLPRADSYSVKLALKGVVSKLLRGNLPLSSLDAVRLVEAVTHRREMFPLKALLGALEHQQMTPALAEALTRLRPMVDQWHGAREMAEIHEGIDYLLDGAKEKPVEPVAAWSRQVMREISGSPKEMFWRALFLHARSLTQSNAPKRWQTEAVAMADKIGRPEFVSVCRRWLALGPMPGTTDVPMPDDEANYQKGFIWILGAIGDVSVAPDIADFAVACFRKIPQIGAVSHRVGNACVNALGAMPGLEAVTQLGRLAMRVKYDVARRLIEKALMQAAERHNVGREDLEAMAVPSFGLDSSGVRIEQMGDCQARLAIEDGKAVLSWSRDGVPLKSPPASLKAEYSDALSEIRKAAKELETVLATQRLRLERHLLSPAACRFENWKAWYLDHPVTSVFARNLIWEVDGQPAILWHDVLIDWAGNPVRIERESMVRLWHPIRSHVMTVLSWRCWLEDHAVRQPFKQAHREVYLLTEAERATDTHSNRFAAHIIRQHQFAALCRERGWRFKLMGQWDSHNTPYLELPQFQLRIEFHVEFPQSEEASAHAVYLTITTDRVEFYTLESKPDRLAWPPPQPLRLENIPAVVFSEVMRDIDLFIGVTSIGSDPAWGRDHREDAHLEYWNHFAFGELNEAAENRRSVIANLIPKLAIRDRCVIDGRYLVVRGHLHEYRIHIGSGNVLMEPGSRYLCIVQGSGDTAGRLPLPFDGDRILAAVLSKAILLANDKGIKDETIRRQLLER